MMLTSCLFVNQRKIIYWRQQIANLTPIMKETTSLSQKSAAREMESYASVLFCHVAWNAFWNLEQEKDEWQDSSSQNNEPRFQIQESPQALPLFQVEDRGLRFNLPGVRVRTEGRPPDPRVQHIKAGHQTCHAPPCVSLDEGTPSSITCTLKGTTWTETEKTICIQCGASRRVPGR